MHRVAAMIDRLRPLRANDRKALLQAAGIGHLFDLELLAAIVRRSPAQVRPALRRACDLQLLVAVDGEPDRFQFRHALTRDAIYDELVAIYLRPLHRQIGRALERLAGPPRVEQLAYHWWAANDPRRGSRYNELAGDRAQAVYADDDALHFYGRARALLRRQAHAFARLDAKIAIIRARIPSTATSSIGVTRFGVTGES